ncbi:hypothetical protein C5E02_01225 [Rathayibacter rathayi]|uniref:Uncharacterized protein n=1 Tax=Rathayibacter rathayi TaxID=33887 RepID=A0ABD6W9C6_RATRA|nr:hypothetical protein [Rathayibacter rathayi]AZZ48001.1 hypothetical protein C1O28_01315 [Rathayibacter rathayi]MWV74727.1 hypothetical protein [Rathayibacter rathayi NCPPB 2980 = VKM Ac-1601]PPF14266.1 hypothetical protein C5C04_07415 [Rathayibacter rathayi]PPF50561.1 hypothetical protein C5C08_04895 [Rathayibacter rathayi]PPF81125.1 hypothetical protein C5C14_05425 [Rathayibacter rathayi]
MTDDGEQVDPRYDPAFQRGFSGGVDRARGDERAFARPATGAATAGSAPGSAAARGSASAPPRLVRPDSSAVPGARRIMPLPDIAGAAEGRRSHRISAETAAAPLPEPVPAPGQQAPAEPAREAPLLRNPWLLVLLLAGLAGSAIGLALLYLGYSSPPPPYYGDSDVPSPAWIQRQLLYYSCIPLLGCLPASLLLALGVAALRWRGVVRSRVEAPAEAAQLLEAGSQAPDAPKSRPRR